MGDNIEIEELKEEMEWLRRRNAELARKLAEANEALEKAGKGVKTGGEETRRAGRPKKDAGVMERYLLFVRCMVSNLDQKQTMKACKISRATYFRYLSMYRENDNQNKPEEDS